jgi:hypothetical protein
MDFARVFRLSDFRPRSCATIASRSLRTPTHGLQQPLEHGVAVNAVLEFADVCEQANLVELLQD